MVRIAVPCEGRGLNSRISPHFGRAPNFALAEVSGGVVRNVEFIANPTAGERVHGAIPHLLASKGVEVVACLGIGPRAVEHLKSLGIRVVRLPPQVRSVDEALNHLIKSVLKP